MTSNKDRTVYLKDVVSGESFNFTIHSGKIEELLFSIKGKPNYEGKDIVMIYNGVAINNKKLIPKDYVEGSHIAIMSKEAESQNLVETENQNDAIRYVQTVNNAIAELVDIIVGQRQNGANVEPRLNDEQLEDIDNIISILGDVDRDDVIRAYELNGRNVETTVMYLLNDVD